MSEEMNMGDVFKLPLQLAVNELVVIDKNDCVVGWVDAFAGEEAGDCIVNAVNNHDTLTEQVRQLREALCELVEASEENEEQLNDLICDGNYGESKALCDARKLLEQAK